MKGYRWPAQYVTPAPEIADALRDWRRAAVRDRELFLAYQKEFSSDRDLSRFFKGEAQFHLRIQRACTLMLPWFGDPDRNFGRAVEPSCWPLDCSDALDTVSYRIVLRFQ